ncbi:hypothetical protein ACFHYQ_28100 [Sphaerimonospora cavernae]|uniref:Transposase DDE domain-containing protein n=1 Tax=Sphaerimonospora cavernae TaxID=1740611 RepID=A0ABV6UDB9_9ACTN
MTEIMTTEVLLVGGYAALLIVIARGLDLMARHAHGRTERFRTGGFRYDPDHDHWTCPQDQLLRPHAYDHHRRLVRYRAPAAACADCPARMLCTDSDDGREITRPVDPWPHSEAGRFHRGIALTLVTLATVIVLAELLRHHHPAELITLGALLTVCLATGWRLTDHLRATPDGFPTPAHYQGLPPTLKGD